MSQSDPDPGSPRALLVLLACAFASCLITVGLVVGTVLLAIRWFT